MYELFLSTGLGILRKHQKPISRKEAKKNNLKPLAKVQRVGIIYERGRKSLDLYKILSCKGQSHEMNLLFEGL